MITRSVKPTVPPQVEYALSPLGKSLLSPVNNLIEWSKVNFPKISTARTKYDTANKKSVTAVA